jgi:hypothetical protein
MSPVFALKYCSAAIVFIWFISLFVKQITKNSVLVVAWRLNKRLLFLPWGREMGQKRMLVAEDHALVREGVITLIEKNKE